MNDLWATPTLIEFFRCECNKGYAGSGKTGDCRNFDECGEEVHNCDINADCIDREGTDNNLFIVALISYIERASHSESVSSRQKR